MSRPGAVVVVGVLMFGLPSLTAMAAAAQASTPLPRELRRWTLSSAPTVTIGAEGDSTTEFLRITGVTRMPSGELVVANGGTSELRVFSPTGRFLRSLSRRGQGPGEVGNFTRIFRARDTLFVTEFSPSSTQLHVFTLGDGFRTRFQLRPPDAPRGASPIARLSTGDFVVAPGGVSVVQPVADVMFRDTMRIGIVDATAQRAIKWLGAFPNQSWLTYASPTMRDGVGFTRFNLGPSLIAGASGDRVWIGDSETGVITVYGADGTSIATARLPVRARPFSAAALARARDRALASATSPDQKARYSSVYDRSRRPRTAPLFTRFIAAVDGQLAVELYEEEDLVIPRSIVIIDGGGTAIAGLIVPANVVLHEIGADYALGVHTDDDGVERVVSYALRR